MEYKYNKYKLTIVDGYIKSYMAVLGDEYDWLGQPAEEEAKHNGVNMAYGCYTFNNGVIGFDNAKYQELKAIDDKHSRIAELKAKLQETDYIYCSLAEQGRPEGYYDEVIAQRKLWRKEIQDLEEELGI